MTASADRIIRPQALTREAFAPYGDVIETDGADHVALNQGMCTRDHDLAAVEARGPGAQVLISIFRGQPYGLPLSLSLVERHPFGTQAFMPLGARPFLVIVCPDGDDGPGRPAAFMTRPGQGVSYRRNQWHGVLTPLGEAQDFLVVDRGGEGSNLEEFVFSEPWTVAL